MNVKLTLFCLDLDGFAIYAADLLKFIIQLFRHRSFICAVTDMQHVNWC